jgi:hypothetical protein
MPGWTADFKPVEKPDGVNAGSDGRRTEKARAKQRKGQTQTAGKQSASRSTRPGGWMRTR